ncbi:ATP-binding cassette domain-containing protein [Paenibacillus sp. FSL H8-0122]|uniref:ABC transporter ATP-binding protein n=1 Tax=Paenibacillus sp. FSL H8-0122 TaxID=2954510 RepID=UPI0030F9A5CF
MILISLEKISKIYRQPIKEKGVAGAMKHLFSPKYVDKIAVNNISLSIREGESVAFLGSNGAGKSTVIKMMTGVLVPTGGDILINKLIPHLNRIQYTKSIGAVFGQRTQMWWDIPILESFRMLKEIYEIPDLIYADNMSTFEDILELGEFIHLSARSLSLGQRMRADLAAAFLHNPKIVFLDEPTIGLDIEVKQRVRYFIKKLNQEKETTVILTTHDLDDIDDICKRLLVIDRGNIIHDGELQQAKDTFARKRVIHIKLKDSVDINVISKELSHFDPGCIDERQISLTFDRFEHTAGSIVNMVMNFSAVVDFSIEEPGINQVVRNINDRSQEKII